MGGFDVVAATTLLAVVILAAVAVSALVGRWVWWR